MNGTKPRRLFDLTSPVWKWSTLLLAFLFITCNIILLTSVEQQQHSVRSNVEAISKLNDLRRSVRFLSRELIGEDRKEGTWDSLFAAYNYQRSQVNLSGRYDRNIAKDIAFSDSLVERMAYIHEAAAIGRSYSKEMVNAFVRCMNDALDALERSVDSIRNSQTMLFASMGRKLTMLGLLVLVACLLAIVINVIFWKYQHDMNARRRAEEALGKASERIFDLYNNAPCGYHSLDESGRFIDMNATELRWLGYSREEVIGKMKFTDILLPGSLETFAKKFSAFMKSGEVKNLEFVLVRKNGTTFPVSLSSTAIFDEQGNYLASRSTVFDTTERKLIEEENEIKNIAVLNAYKKLEIASREQQAANKDLESFSYSVSHDLRAPLRAINGYAQILEEDYNDKLDDEGRRLLSVVRYSAGKMGRLIDDLLAFSKLGRQEVKRIVIDMNELAEATLRDTERNHGPLKATVIIQDLSPAWGDYALISQVMSNLLANAVKYSSKKDKPVIEVGGKQTSEEHIYYVKDNGAGFDMEYAHKLFGVFQRLHHTQDFEGTGVGLAIVERIITRHGGRVWAEGKPEEGACFYFSLPVS
jgi:PAS domain S-box-containing protein